jgi:hypothetical protein
MGSYVKECKPELSHLAHNAVRSNRYRPETCCIVGNYYSLKGQHEVRRPDLTVGRGGLRLLSWVAFAATNADGSPCP